MRVSIEITVGDVVLSITQEEGPLASAMALGRDGAVARLLGTSVGKVLVALASDSDVDSGLLVVEFQEAVARTIARTVLPGEAPPATDRVTLR